MDILGNCTGRKLPVSTDAAHASSRRRPPSSFDVEAVCAAALRHDKAIEINSRPDRLDPPSGILRKRASRACGSRSTPTLTPTNSCDGNGTGASERAGAAGVTGDRVVNTWPLPQLLSWSAGHRQQVRHVRAG